MVDDEDGVRAVMRRLLRNWEVIECQNAAEALEHLAVDEGFDVILCDIRMPRMGGPEFWRALCAHHPTLTARVAFMTGGVDGDEDEQFLADPARRVLFKPFDLATVRTLVETMASSGSPPVSSKLEPR